MTFNDTEISVGEGIGLLLFGMNETEVVHLIGKPNEVEKVEDDEDEIGGTTYHYDELGLSLSFEEGDGLTLTSLSTTDAKYSLKNRNLIGMLYDDFMEIEDSLELGPMVYDNITEGDGPKQVVLEFEESGVSFWFDDDKLTEIQCSPVWSDGDDLWVRETETKISDKLLDYDETYGEG